MLWLNGTFDYNPNPVQQISFGQGRIAELPAFLQQVEGSRALLVTSPSVRNSAPVRQAESVLGNSLVGVFDGTRPHSPIEVVREAADYADQVGADTVVSLGGGSCVDTAKGVVHFHLEKTGNRLPHIAIPTTLSGAEFTRAAGITDGAVKRPVRGLHMVASLVVLDPDAVAITPTSLIFPSGLNAMHHCIEGLSSTGGNGISDAMFLHAIRLLRTSLPKLQANPNDTEAWALAQVGAAQGCMAIWGVPMGMGHALAHAIGGMFKTPHANTHAVLIAPVMEYNQDAVLSAQAAIAEAMGVKENTGTVRDVAQEGINRIRQLQADLGMKTSLSQLGVSGDDGEISAAAEIAEGDNSFPTNPKPATKDDIIGVIKRAL